MPQKKRSFHVDICVSNRNIWISVSFHCFWPWHCVIYFSSYIFLAWSVQNTPKDINIFDCVFSPHDQSKYSKKTLKPFIVYFPHLISPKYTKNINIVDCVFYSPDQSKIHQLTPTSLIVCFPPKDTNIFDFVFSSPYQSTFLACALHPAWTAWLETVDQRNQNITKLIQITNTRDQNSTMSASREAVKGRRWNSVWIISQFTCILEELI